MYICYLDESGTDLIGSGTSHFVYTGLAIPIETWKEKDKQVSDILQGYEMRGAEAHAGWIARRYTEQERIAGFEGMDYAARRAAVAAERQTWLIRTAALKDKKTLEILKKNLRKTEPYVHLTRKEREQLLRDLANLVGTWHDARLFCDATDKASYSGKTPPTMPLYDSAFMQLVARFEAFLMHKGDRDNKALIGMLVHDNNQTVALRLTNMMRRFHAGGTEWRQIPHIVETPLFVDSSLTAMVQIADLCAYATRRFFEHNNTDLFDRIYKRFDRTGTRVVGIRHYRHETPCACRVCKDHYSTARVRRVRVRAKKR